MPPLTEHLLEFAEGFDFEVKAGQGADGKGELPKDFWKTYSAFANTSGGRVFLGIKEPKVGQFEVIGLEKPEKIQKELWDLLNDRKKVSINLLQESDVQIIPLEGKSVLRIAIPRSPRRSLPVYIHGNPMTGTYKRGHEGDFLCTEEEVRRMMAEQGDVSSRDSRVLPHFTWNDVDQDTFNAYRMAMQNRKPDHVFATQGPEDFLYSLGGWGRDREKGIEGLTVAGLLMFGKWRSIIDEFPNYILDYRELPEDRQQSRWIDRLTSDGSWSGNLFDFYRKVYLKLTDGLKVPFFLKGDERQDETAVHEALREALANCLIHADYTGNRSILVVKRPSLFGFRNPGRMRVSIEQALRGGESDCRNKVLQNMFLLIGRGERVGSGIPTIYRNWAGQHWRKPEIWEELEPEQTLLTLRTESLLPEEAVAAVLARFGERFHGLEEVARIALVTVEIEGYLTHARLSQLCEMHPHDLSCLLAELVEGGFLESDKRGRGTSYRFPGMGERQIKEEEASLFPVSKASQSINGSTHLEASSTHLEASSTHLEASSTHLEASSTQKNAEKDAHLLELASPIRNIGRADPALTRSVILALCKDAFLTGQQISELLNRNSGSIQERFLRPLVREKKLTLLYPHSPNHEQQAYKASDTP